MKVIQVFYNTDMAMFSVVVKYLDLKKIYFITLEHIVKFN